MKTLLKIAAIAAITALAVISCSPPEVPEAHFDWWDEVNEQFDASTYTDNTGYAGFSVNSSLTAYPAGYTGTKSDNTATITFPAKADILKKDTITTADLKSILSFNTFNPSVTLVAGTADTFSDLSGWEFDRRTGNIIYIKLPALSDKSSHIVFKLDSTKYTVSNGLKVDKDGNGIAGEAIYDDIYKVLNVDNLDWINNYGRSPVLPGNKGWTVYLYAPYDVDYENTDSSGLYDAQLAYADISGITDTDYNTIINSLKGGFKIEQFSDGKWSAYSSTITTTDITTYNTKVDIIAKNFRAAHNTAYRTVFEKGSISLETTQTFFGVKQRIRINGDTGSIYDSAKTNKARVESGSSLYYNNDRLAFKDFTSSIDGYSNLLYSHDSSGGNVVLKIKLTSPSQSPTTPIIYYYFRQLDLTAFKNNFKIYSYNVDWYDDGNDNWYPYPSSIQDAKDVTEIGIQKVEFKQEFTGTPTNVSGYNVIYITLDPNYVKNSKQKYFYIGNGFVLNDGITVLVRDHDDYIKGYSYYYVSGF